MTSSQVSVCCNAHTLLLTDHAEDSDRPLLDNTSSVHSDYSTTVIRSHPVSHSAEASSLSSILTIRPAQTPNGSDDLTSHPLATGAHGPTPTDSLITIDSYHTAGSMSAFELANGNVSDSEISIAAATEGSTMAQHTSFAVPLVHRFTLIKPGGRRMSVGGVEPRSGTTSPARINAQEAAGWSPLDFLFSSTLLGAKCDICLKRLGWKPVLECDDCGMRYASLSFDPRVPCANSFRRAHIKCGEVAPLDCGIRPARSGAFHDDHRARSASPVAKDKAKLRKGIGAPAK